MHRHVTASLVACLALATACGGSADPAPGSSAPRASVASATAGALTVELLTDTRLETGLTPVYVKVTEAGRPVTDATVTFAPLMQMATMSHGAPIAAAPTGGSDGVYAGAVVFQMASGAAGSWSAKVSVQRPGQDVVEASFPDLAVADSGRAKVIRVTDAANVTTKYVMSLNFKSAPKVGLNPVVVTMHRSTMAGFPPCDDMTVALDPQMPAMGHGSPGSVDPTLVSPGRYEGQLSFSMPGEWETTVTLRDAGVVLPPQKFTVTF
jgi:hypothetical protein